jgi:hypothetical protein
LFYQWREKSGFEIHFQALMHPAVSWGPTGRSPWVLENDRMFSTYEEMLKADLTTDYSDEHGLGKEEAGLRLGKPSWPFRNWLSCNRTCRLALFRIAHPLRLMALLLPLTLDTRRSTLVPRPLCGYPIHYPFIVLK